MIPLKLAALAAAPFALAGSVALSGPTTLVVDVREGGAEGMHLVIPVPLLAARAAAALVSEDKARIPVAELQRAQPGARALLAELRRLPDVELVRVQQQRGGGLVRIAKRGDALEVRVRQPSENVKVRAKLPLAVVEELLRRAEDGDLDPGDVVAAFGKAPHGTFVEVEDGEDRVKVRLW